MDGRRDHYRNLAAIRQGVQDFLISRDHCVYQPAGPDLLAGSLCDDDGRIYDDVNHPDLAAQKQYSTLASGR